MVDKVVRDGKVAVLISPNYGAGWSTWASDKMRDAALFDRRFVEAAEAGVTDIDPIAEQVFGKDAYFCTSGWRNIQIEWLDKGTAFYVDEYDGSETVRTIADMVIVA